MDWFIGMLPPWAQRFLRSPITWLLIVGALATGCGGGAQAAASGGAPTSPIGATSQATGHSPAQANVQAQRGRKPNGTSRDACSVLSVAQIDSIMGTEWNARPETAPNPGSTICVVSAVGYLAEMRVYAFSPSSTTNAQFQQLKGSLQEVGSSGRVVTDGEWNVAGITIGGEVVELRMVLRANGGDALTQHAMQVAVEQAVGA